MQGFNMGRYVPPEHEGVRSANQVAGKHGMGSRASKAGALTVRFEMPFAVWCETCAPPTLIGQGVRFNASKSKVGAYHSTAIYAFRMRHPACGGWLEIRTDPANTAYVVTEGGKRRGEKDDGDSLVSAVDFRSDKEKSDARETAFADLERTIAHREALEGAKERIGQLEDESARRWETPYERNAALRRAFRAGRKGREAAAAADEDLRERMSLGIELVPATDEDRRRAALVDFGVAEDGDGDGPVARVLAQPLFGMGVRGQATEDGEEKKTKQKEKKAEEDEEEERRRRRRQREPSEREKGGGGRRGERGGGGTGKPTPGKPRMLKPELLAAKTKDGLLSEVMGNTRRAKDPFLDGGSARGGSKGLALLAGLKRKRDNHDGPGPGPRPEDERRAGTDSRPSTPAAVSLVSYDSE